MKMDELVHVSFLEPCLSSSQCSTNVSRDFMLLLLLFYMTFNILKKEGPYFKKKVQGKGREMYTQTARENGTLFLLPSKAIKIVEPAIVYLFRHQS